MRAEIVTVGDEICRGEIVDANSAWLAEALWELDVTVAWMTSCRDDAADMRDALERASRRTDLVLTTGGLGPTEDDLTVDVVADLLGVEAEVHAPSLERMEERFRAIRMPLVANSRRQVRTPAGARVHENPVGAAPAFEVKLGGALVMCLPGPPRELHAIFREHLVDRIVALREERGERTERIARRIYRVFGRGESSVAAVLEDLPLASGDSLHFQVAFPEVLVKIVVRRPELFAAEARLAEIDAEIRPRLEPFLYGIDDDSLAAALGRELLARDLTLATAESCTGGLAGALITAVTGASSYFLGSAVCYSNAEKVRALGVSEATLERHGAVSREVVVEMARGARERLGADVAVAITGIAGPGGGTEDKPVGTVWIGVDGPGERHRSKRYQWRGGREQVRILAAHWALEQVRLSLIAEDEDA